VNATPAIWLIEPGTEPGGLPARSRFDLMGPLPSGTTLLEASAGTGKTWTVAALVTRYVAEGVAELSELLLVTFGRAATAELRERVRDRLTQARDVLAGEPGVESDELIAHLAAGPDDLVAERLARLRAATANFDAAAIVTTHRLCQLVIRGLGTAADADPETELLEDPGELVREVALDLYLRKWAAVGEPAFGVPEALTIAAAAVNDTHALLAPEPGADCGSAGLRTAFARAVRREVAVRLRARRAMSFDDLLVGLRDALFDPHDGPAVAARLRSRFRVVLVDEFQDTDPVQWQILSTAFAGHSTLVLIGDPKQSIYAFRGADLHSYLAAAAAADEHAGLPVNWRSDAGVLRGVEALFGGAALGDARIVVTPVVAGRPQPLLRRPKPRAGVQLRLHPAAGLPARSDGLPLTPGAREAVTADLVAEIVDVLTDGTTFAAAGAVPRPVSPGDIAVLVRTNSQAEQVRAALVAAGVPSVVHARTNVFATPAATDWLVLLESLEQPHRTARIRRLAASAFVGADAVWLAEGGEGHDRLARQVHAWAGVLAADGVAAAFAAVDAEAGTTARLLRHVGGERRATDLRHIAEVLHAAALAESLGPAALLTWLRRRMLEALRREPGAERIRRLDSDALAVQVVTVHMSKGLEFPLVYVPFAWSRRINEPGVALYHDEGGRRIRDVGGPDGSGWRAAVAAHLREEDGEDLRLLYVAATRARSALTLWWVRSTTTAGSALHRLLFAAPGGGPGKLPDDEAALTAGSARAEVSGGGLEVVPVRPRQKANWVVPLPSGGAPAAAVLDRELDLDWRRTSYSTLVAAAHEQPTPPDRPAPTVAVGAEPESTGTLDEPDAVADEAGPDPAPVLPAPPLAALPSGTTFGTLVHSILEAVDPSDGDPAVLRAQCAIELSRNPMPGLTADALSAALAVALRTPLGPLADGRCLAEFGRADRLAELEFELPLRGGDRPGHPTRLGDLASILDRHLVPDDPVRVWLPRLADADLAAQSLRGYLTGSIDAVLRLRESDAGRGCVRYLVVDYKTNRLHPGAGPAELRHYRRDALAAAMNAADYPLQALLYQVAVHRYLTWRQPAYEPDRHLGGVLYLFLRGMPGPLVPADVDVPGVFAWRPATAAIVAVDEWLAGFR